MLIIKNGTVFIKGKFSEQNIAIDIENGVIFSIGNCTNFSGVETVNAKGMLVLPGLIDPHVHLREPGDIQKEDFKTGGRAAIAGGFTTVMDMPNNKVPTTTKERYEEKIRLARQKALCDVFFHFGGVDDNFAEVEKIATIAPSMKLYLGETTGMMVLRSQASVEKHFKIFPKNKPIVLHTADHSQTEEEGLAKTYKMEEDAVALAKKLGRRIHVAHASTVREIQIARSYPKCTVETAPHYLFLSSADAERLGKSSFGKVFPPLRSEKERSGLWDAIAQVDCIATDHAPHTKEDKVNGAGGFPGLETSLALMLKACELGRLSKPELFKKMSENPAKIFGLSKRGKLEKGFIGDITIVDPNKIWTVKGDEMETKCKWSPYEGMELKGKVHTVIKSGKIVYQDYEFL
jgi:dihydroorotase